jgi:hypothetical protein
LEEDHLEQFHSVVRLKGRITENHFVEETAETPPINIDAMTCLPDHFRGKIFGSSANRQRAGVLGQYFRKTEISELNIA